MQIPQMTGNWGLIDVDTPQDLWTRASFYDPSQTLQLVFSDEFNTDGRTFYPGDDPYWEAVDLHYWQTGDLEWYEPSAITTNNGALEITLSEKPTHNLNYSGGMMTTWNKFCFTGGIFEANVSLPGANDVFGLWPAVWAMGNLGRAGYGASLEGMVRIHSIPSLLSQTFILQRPVAIYVRLMRLWSDRQPVPNWVAAWRVSGWRPV
jgi:hypothetical protein